MGIFHRSQDLSNEKSLEILRLAEIFYRIKFDGNIIILKEIRDVLWADQKDL
jgi:hypothetical protein